MKETIKFLAFILYATLIFFLPNEVFVMMIVLLLNLFLGTFAKISLKKTFAKILNIMPFVMFTVVVNCLLDNFKDAFFVGIKLIFVCNITFIYAKTTTVFKMAKVIKLLCQPLKILGVKVEEIEILVCISLSMIPILKQEIIEIKNACIAKGIKFNIKNMKIILSKLLISIIKRVNQIEEAMTEKGCSI